MIVQLQTTFGDFIGNHEIPEVRPDDFGSLPNIIKWRDRLFYYSGHRVLVENDFAAVYKEIYLLTGR